MDAGYALLVEEYLRVGIPLLETLEQTNNLRAGGPAVQDEEPSEVDLAQQNQASMQQLQQMMSGLGS